MIQGDFIGILFVYGYVALLLGVTEKVLVKHPETSRKVLHIMVGNIAFLLPIFVSREMMAFVAAGPFIFLTFLMSPYTPIKSIRGKTSSAGHGMGLVYYAITWTVLAYLFFDYMIVIAIGIFAMSYGDGFASLVGVKYGRHKYNIAGDEKSFIGTIAMFFSTFVAMIVAIVYYNIVQGTGFHFTFISVGFLALFAAAGAIVEGFTPKGLDNLTVPFVIAAMYWMVFII
ncbi:MAG: phosphatidate cytidylyltransferase [Candidatus Thermoplasmatota archaeon]|nr:phosphatidate cytidylyltransferase [Candidatus Thermoplasmatota archaeon]